MQDIKTEIVRLLKESTGYISGQDLCQKLKVSRTAVWKYMNKLKEEGYQLEAVPNKGYRLLGSPDILSQSEIKSRIHTGWAGQTICSYLEVDSTNEEAKRIAEQGGKHGTLVVSEEQSLGKGRRGRTWISSKGNGIFMTLLLRPKMEPSQASMLTLVAALGVTEALEEICGVNAQIKWPNDIVINGKKVCGILTEMSAEMEEIHYIVVGIGINVNQDNFTEEIRQVATSILEETKKKWNRADIIASFLHHFERVYESFWKARNLRDLKEEYERRLVNIKKQVRICDSQGEYLGVALGIDESGALLVKKEEGVVAVTSGEVSVRGIYGYV